MTGEAELDDVVRQLTEVRETLEEMFSSSHSLKFLWRGFLSGVDYAAQAVRLAALEEKVDRLGASFYKERIFDGGQKLRLARAYWCYVFLATSALVEWAEDMDREFRGESGYDRGERQFAVRRYVDAIGRSRSIEKRLFTETWRRRS